MRHDTLAADRWPPQPLIHGYDAVDMEVFWQILSSDLPPLITELEHVLGGAAGKR
jgi:uncharacterized protein with HEPN domain